MAEKNQMGYRIYKFIKEKYGTQPYMYANQIIRVRELFNEFLSKHLLDGDIMQLPKNSGTLFITRSKKMSIYTNHSGNKFIHKKYNNAYQDGYFYRLSWSMVKVPGQHKKNMISFTTQEFRKKMSNLINNGKLYPYISTWSLSDMIRAKNNLK